MAETKTVNGITYSDFTAQTPEAMQNERRALLALMSEHGTEGQAELVKAQERARAARAASIEKAAARGAAIHAPAALSAEIAQEDDRVMAGLRDNQVSSIMGHGREMDRIAAANAAYLEQVGGASSVLQTIFEQALANQGGTSSGGGSSSGSSSGSWSPEPTVPQAAFDAFGAGQSIGTAVQRAAAEQYADESRNFMGPTLDDVRTGGKTTTRDTSTLSAKEREERKKAATIDYWRSKFNMY